MSVGVVRFRYETADDVMRNFMYEAITAWNRDDLVEVRYPVDQSSATFWDDYARAAIFEILHALNSRQPSLTLAGYAACRCQCDGEYERESNDLVVDISADTADADAGPSAAVTHRPSSSYTTGTITVREPMLKDDRTRWAAMGGTRWRVNVCKNIGCALLVACVDQIMLSTLANSIQLVDRADKEWHDRYSVLCDMQHLVVKELNQIVNEYCGKNRAADAVRVLTEAKFFKMRVNKDAPLPNFVEGERKKPGAGFDPIDYHSIYSEDGTLIGGFSYSKPLAPDPAPAALSPASSSSSPAEKPKRPLADADADDANGENAAKRRKVLEVS